MKVEYSLVLKNPAAAAEVAHPKLTPLEAAIMIPLKYLWPFAPIAALTCLFYVVLTVIEVAS